MTTSETQGQTARSTVPSAVAWQWARGAVGLISAGIGVYQLLSGHDMGGAFSFLMAAMFLLSVPCDRAVLRARREGAPLPLAVLILVYSTGAAMGGTLVLGLQLAMRAL
jgi:hypothetical protein